MSAGLTVELGTRGIDPDHLARFLALATIFDARLDAQVARALLDRSLNQLTGKRLGVWVGKRIPLVGGGVGAAVDGWSTLSVARHAMHEFPNRRPRPSGSVTTSP